MRPCRRKKLITRCFERNKLRGFLFGWSRGDGRPAKTRQENDMPNQGGTHEQHVKAGQQSHKNDGKQQRQAASDHDRNKDGGQQRGGSGNFAQDRERASEAGRKGGQH